MQRVYVVQAKTIERNDILGITLESENVLDIILNYLHDRVDEAASISTQANLELEKSAMNQIWDFFKEYEFDTMRLSTSVTYGVEWYRITVSAYELYERWHD